MSEPLGQPFIAGDDFAAISQEISTFSLLEDELMRAIITMNGAHENTSKAPAGFLDRFSKIVSCGFKLRVEHFIAEYQCLRSKDDRIGAFEVSIQDAINMRDHIAHGVWSKLSDGRLKCVFFSRTAIKRGDTHSELSVHAKTLREVAALNIETSKDIMKKFGSDWE